MIQTLSHEPELAELTIADPADGWRALGFEVDDADNLDIGGVRIRLGGEGAGITSWSLRRLRSRGSIDGLSTSAPTVMRPPPFQTHPNGATGVDQIVVLSSDFDRTSSAFAHVGLELKRTIEHEQRGRLGFRRVGPAVLELVQPPEMSDGATQFWGIAVVVISLEDLAERLGDLLGEVRPALQPGRRIATLNRSAGLSVRLAFLSPEL